MRRADYGQVRELMAPGDLIFFGGKGGISDGIKLFTRSATSHVGVIRRARLTDDVQPGRYFNEVIESTSLDGRLGVVSSRLSVRIASYAGHVWWAPLSEVARSRLRLEKFWDWLYAQEGKPYDFAGAIKAGVDLFGDRILHAREDLSKLFCSELVAGALEAAGVLPSLNVSEVVPQDLAEMALYAELVQIAGDPTPIRGFNTTPPEMAARRFR